MNIEINLLPEELRPRPLVETRTFIVAVVVVALVAGGVLMYMQKSNEESERVSMENRITQIDQEIAALAATARALTTDIDDLKTANKNYEAFDAARIDWGDAVDRMQELVPQGIVVMKLTQDGRTVLVEGRATGGYGAVASYGRSLDLDRRFVLTDVPALSGSEFSLVLKVAAGGGS